MNRADANVRREVSLGSEAVTCCRDQWQFEIIYDAADRKCRTETRIQSEAGGPVVCIGGSQPHWKFEIDVRVLSCGSQILLIQIGDIAEPGRIAQTQAPFTGMRS